VTQPRSPRNFGSSRMSEDVCAVFAPREDPASKANFINTTSLAKLPPAKVHYQRIGKSRSIGHRPGRGRPAVNGGLVRHGTAAPVICLQPGQGIFARERTVPVRAPGEHLLR
jgi:hypothetical protein